MRPVTIDVVIPVRDRWELTHSCLMHLRDQTVPHTVVVCDNGSSDETRTRLQDSFPEVRVVELGANLGFSVACNRGVLSGDTDIIVLLNNDVEARPDFLERIVRPIVEDTRVGSTAGLLLQPDEIAIDSMGVTVDATLSGFPRLRRRPIDDAASVTPLLTGPIGGAGAYRRTAWEQVGGLDEGVLFYGEDVDLALRLRAAGWRTSAAPGAVAVHLGSATARHRSGWQRYQGGFARGYFLHRYRVLRGAPAVRALVTEAIVVAGDAYLSRDLSALRGRIAGWRAAGGLSRTPWPPPDAIDKTIGFRESLSLRRTVYAG